MSITERERYDECLRCLRDTAIELRDREKEIAALREKLEKAEARVAVLTAALRDAIAVCRGIVGAEFPEEMHADVLSGLESSVEVYEATISATGPLPAKEGTDA